MLPTPFIEIASVVVRVVVVMMVGAMRVVFTMGFPVKNGHDATHRSCGGWVKVSIQPLYTSYHFHSKRTQMDIRNDFLEWIFGMIFVE